MIIYIYNIGSCYIPPTYDAGIGCIKAHPNQCYLGNCKTCWWESEEVACLQCAPAGNFFIKTASAEEYLTTGGECFHQCNARNFSIASLQFTKINLPKEIPVKTDICMADGK